MIRFIDEPSQRLRVYRSTCWSVGPGTVPKSSEPATLEDGKHGSARTVAMLTWFHSTSNQGYSDVPKSAACDLWFWAYAVATAALVLWLVT